MIDYHCHLDLYPNPLKLLDEVRSRRMDILAVTTSPRAYMKTSQYFVAAEKVRVALGFHPELVAQRTGEWEMFFNAVKDCKYLGEIGIDGSQQYSALLDAQTSFFEQALIESEKHNGRIISIHSRNAAKRVLSVIERTVGLNKPVLHWFTGSNKELEWALELGCWFSINPKMCISKIGRETIRRIPLSKILPETDGPFVVIRGKICLPWNNEVPKFLAEQKKLNLSCVLKVFDENLKRLEIHIKEGA